MNARQPHVVILGSGPAGLGAAYRLRHTNKASVTVLERSDRIGGNSGSFRLHGIPVDFGSHRLHPSCDAEILGDIRSLLGADLLDRPRHGRIRLQGRWLHFPLKPADLLVSMPPRFGLGVLGDSVRRPFARRHTGPETFATVLEAGLGRTICRDFYFPYAVKMWGEDPTALSAVQAQRRVSAGSLGKMVRRVLTMVPGLKRKGAGRFFYPRHGFGQICHGYHEAALEAGAMFVAGATVREVRLAQDHVAVVYEDARGRTQLRADQVWSTIPITALARLTQPGSPEAQEAAAGIRFRAMVLAYVVLPVGQFTEFDAHYFPEVEIPFTRLSEPKNYHAGTDPENETVLCAEIPCSRDDAVWTASASELGEIVATGLARADIPLPAAPLDVHVERLDSAYPIYDDGYERAFDAVDSWASAQDRLLSFGRQGLFAHDNTHHALAMAYRAVDCLTPDGTLDAASWSRYRDEFRAHVVED